MPHTWNTAIVVGASSGIGEMIARRLAAAGTYVALVGRSGERMERIAKEINAATAEARAITAVHDVNNTGEASTLFQSLSTQLGGCDLLVYSSGILPEVRQDEYDIGTDEEVVRVNTIGGMAWIGAAARVMGERRSGSIVGISSIAGERGRRGNPAYCASKAALTSYLESVRNRIAVRGVHVMTAKPGFVRSPMTTHLEKMPMAVDADRAAELILRAARRGASTVYIPTRWRFVAMMLRLVPSFIFRRLNI